MDYLFAEAALGNMKDEPREALSFLVNARSHQAHHQHPSQQVNEAPYKIRHAHRIPLVLALSSAQAQIQLGESEELRGVLRERSEGSPAVELTCRQVKKMLVV